MAAPTYGRLASVAATSTDTTLYAPATGRVVKGKVRICNRSTTANDTVRLYHVDAVNVVTIDTADYGANINLGPSETVELDNEIVKGGECLGCYSLNSTSTFQLIGVLQDQ